MCFIRLLGLILMAGGGGWILAIFGFNSMIDSRLDSDDWWAEYWSKLFRNGGIVMIAVGLTTTLLGGWLVIVRIDNLTGSDHFSPPVPLPPLKPFNLDGKRDEYF